MARRSLVTAEPYPGYISHFGSALVPVLLMLGVGGQVRARGEDLVVVVGVQVLGLEVVHDPDGGDCPGEFAEGVIDVGGLQLHQLGEALIRFGCLGADGAAFRPRARCVRVLTWRTSLRLR